MKKNKLSSLADKPYLVWSILFIIAPLLMVAYYALTDKSGAFSLASVEQIPTYITTILLSVLYGVAATAICLVLGFPFAYIFSKAPQKYKNIVVLLVMLPMWMNFLIRTYSWMTILGDSGVINTILNVLGLKQLKLINNGAAVILGMVYNFLPYMILPIFSVLTKLDNSLIEAAQDLGSNKFEVIKNVIIPLSKPGILSGITMVFVPCVSTFYITQKLGGGQVVLIGDVIETQFQSANNYNLGAALSFVLMILIFICLGVMNYFGAPIAVMMLFSLNSTSSTYIFSGFSTHWYNEMFKDTVAVQALKNTVLLAVCTALVSTVLGVLAAVGLFNSKSKLYKSAMMTTTNIPMMNPEIVTGIAMMLLFVFAGSLVNKSDILGFWTLLIAHVTFALPYVILNVIPKLKQFDMHVYEAALDLGCKPIKAFFKVVMPEILSGIITGCVMSFTLSLDDFIISYFTNGPSFQTLPIYIFSMTKKRVKPDMYALSTLMFISILVLLVLMNIAQSKAEKKGKREAK